MFSSFVLLNTISSTLLQSHFTALLLNELLMVALEINMALYNGIMRNRSIFIYILSVRFLETEFDRPFMTSISFFTKSFNYYALFVYAALFDKS